jgi:hypothetical protein
MYLFENTNGELFRIGVGWGGQRGSALPVSKLFTLISIQNFVDFTNPEILLNSINVDDKVYYFFMEPVSSLNCKIPYSSKIKISQTIFKPILANY